MNIQKLLLEVNKVTATAQAGLKQEQEPARKHYLEGFINGLAALPQIINNVNMGAAEEVETRRRCPGYKDKHNICQGRVNKILLRLLCDSCFEERTKDRLELLYGDSENVNNESR